MPIVRTLVAWARPGPAESTGRRLRLAVERVAVRYPGHGADVGPRLWSRRSGGWPPLSEPSGIVDLVNGGMGRHSRGRLIDRVKPGPTVDDVPEQPPPPDVKHVWVTTEHGRHAGLLIRWQKVASGWQGYVTHPIPDGDGWALVDEWLPAEQLQHA